MADKLTKDQAGLFTFNQIGACVTSGLLSMQDAGQILVERAQRKATQKGVTVDSNGAVKA